MRLALLLALLLLQPRPSSSTGERTTLRLPLLPLAPRLLTAAASSSGVRLDGAALQGQFGALAYHFVELAIGSPPQRFSAVVDSASSLLAVPCAGCHSCGRAQRRFFRNASSSARRVPCAAGGGGGCDSCVTLAADEEGGAESGAGAGAGAGECAYERSYSEGSSTAGVFLTDLVSLAAGEADGRADFAFPRSEVQFGCQLSADGLMAAQATDGILGLSQGRLSLLSSMHGAGLLARNAFSLCLAADGSGGVMTLGGSDPRLRAARRGAAALPPATRMDIVPTNGFYVVSLQAVRLVPGVGAAAAAAAVAGGRLRGRALAWVHMSPAAGENDPAAARPAVLDTGSTYTYLHVSALDSVLLALRQLCGAGICPGAIVESAALPEQQTLCFSGLGEGALLEPAAAAARQLPTLQLLFADGAVFDVPLARLLMRTSWTRGLHCLGLFASARAAGRLVLGANLMHGLDVTFDAEGGRWSWDVAVNCSSAVAPPRVVGAAEAEADNARAGILPLVAAAGGESGQEAGEWEAVRLLLVGMICGVLAVAALVLLSLERRRCRGGGAPTGAALGLRLGGLGLGSKATASYSAVRRIERIDEEDEEEDEEEGKGAAAGVPQRAST